MNQQSKKQPNEKQTYFNSSNNNISSNKYNPANIMINLAEFMDSQIRKINKITAHQAYEQAVYKELKTIASTTMEEIEPFSGGTGTISVTDYDFTLNGLNFIINGEIKYVVCSYENDHNYGVSYDLEDGFFEGTIHVSERDEVIEDFDLLISVG
jgi:hypothetical protein